MKPLSPFHLAIPVSDLVAAARFYEEELGCDRGRFCEDWIDLNFYGHQLVLHRVSVSSESAASNPVDGEQIPVPHFGVVLPWAEHEALVSRLEAASVEFALAPVTRFAGRAGEQRTFFLRDPCGNFLEFKTFKEPERLFESDLERYV